MINRMIKSKIDEALMNYPVVIISGARQVGKSTLAYQYVKENNYSYFFGKYSPKVTCIM